MRRFVCGCGWFRMKCFLMDLQSSGIVHFGVTALDWAYMPELTTVISIAGVGGGHCGAPRRTVGRRRRAAARSLNYA
jgi:hypothetical protein